MFTTNRILSPVKRTHNGKTNTLATQIIQQLLLEWFLTNWEQVNRCSSPAVQVVIETTQRGTHFGVLDLFFLNRGCPARFHTHHAACIHCNWVLHTQPLLSNCQQTPIYHTSICTSGSVLHRERASITTLAMAVHSV